MGLYIRRNTPGTANAINSLIGSMKWILVLRRDRWDVPKIGPLITPYAYFRHISQTSGLMSSVVISQCQKRKQSQTVVWNFIIPRNTWHPITPFTSAGSREALLDFAEFCPSESILITGVDFLCTGLIGVDRPLLPPMDFGVERPLPPASFGVNMPPLECPLVGEQGTLFANIAGVFTIGADECTGSSGGEEALEGPRSEFAWAESTSSSLSTEIVGRPSDFNTTAPLKFPAVGCLAL